MARKKHVHHEEHENHERWLVSYADFITLLFAFFTVLYATNQAAVKNNAAAKKAASKEQAKASASIKNALHATDSSGGSPSVLDGSIGKDEGESNLDPAAVAINEARKRIEQRLAGLVKDPERPPPATVFQDPKRLSIRLQANSFFNPGEAVLKPDVMPALDAVGLELARLNRPVRIEGHTDASPPSRTSSYKSNWALSAARAVAVTEYMVDAHHMPARYLMAAGLGDTKPLGDNRTEPGREANRRIEMVVAIMPEDPLDAVVK
jgi:chemotaxis protein MotB